MLRNAFILALASVFACGCAGGKSAKEPGERSYLKQVEKETPAEIRAIETVIDRGGCIKAERVEIYVSRNYEWDVALTGAKVHKQKHVGNDEHQSMAEGNPRAMFRNLDIRAYQTITFRKSGFDVVPFIRIRAQGRALYIEPKQGGGFKVRHANAIHVDNANVKLLGERRRTPRPASAPGGHGDADAPGLRGERGTRSGG